ncbi:MAG: hypothetical protein LC098_09460 [Burkholderiales bacterium]|nr:hypothetical protein [Burkholderiales bacterium]
MAIAAAKRLRPLYHDQAPAAIERTADTVMGVLRRPSIPLRCIEATLAWNGSSFFVKAASMTGLARHFAKTRLCLKSGAKPVTGVIGAKSQCARDGHDTAQTTPSASVASMERSGIEGIRQKFRVREVTPFVKTANPESQVELGRLLERVALQREQA